MKSIEIYNGNRVNITSLIERLNYMRAKGYVNVDVTAEIVRGDVENIIIRPTK